MNELLAILFKLIPHIGDYWITEQTATAADYWGFGTWELVENRMLVGAGDLYSVGSQDGSKDAIVVAHSHTPSDEGANWVPNTTSITRVAVATNSSSAWRCPGGQGLDAWKWSGTSTKGVSGTDKNMPPYRAVNIWRRTA